MVLLAMIILITMRPGDEKSRSTKLQRTRNETQTKHGLTHENNENNENEKKELELAKRFFYLRLTAFNNHVQFNKKQTMFTSSRDKRVKCYQTLLSKYEHVFNTNSDNALLRQIDPRRVRFLCDHYRNVFDNHSNLLNNKETLLYLDPPFIISGHKYYNQFDLSEYKVLAIYLKKIKCRWLLTIPYHEDTHYLFEKYFIDKYEKTFIGNINKHSKNFICVYTNFEKIEKVKNPKKAGQNQTKPKPKNLVSTAKP